jgi:hypothetical protein
MSVHRSDITNEEFAFLAEHKIHWENLFDARDRTATGWDKEAKNLGIDFGLSKPCYKGHRLRDRKGHCIQCQTSHIAFIRRASATGFVYIAVSRKSKLYKIGSTIDYKQRKKALQREAYAGSDDWVMICVCRVKNSGKVEFEIHKKLVEFKVGATYKNAGKEISATEVIKTNLTNVWQAYQTSVDWRNLPENSKSRAKNFSAFDFKS